MCALRSFGAAICAFLLVAACRSSERKSPVPNPAPAAAASVRGNGERPGFKPVRLEFSNVAMGTRVQ
ncbi:MAG TPA: hypothetical protein VK524_17805, partial [Polyangiaceae bacterium]|nr:hypothetical protein [Polyangiaceae bacterium]